MKNKTSDKKSDKLDQLGGTDQIEQLAADLSIQDDREQVSDKDRQEAVHQMTQMSPPVRPEKPKNKASPNK